MDKLGLVTSTSPDNMNQANPQEEQKLAIQRCSQSLTHAYRCRDGLCRLPSCQKMKRVLAHTKICKQRKKKGDCPICQNLINLYCSHGKLCQETQCTVVFCSIIKQKLKQRQQAESLREWMAAMDLNTHVKPASPPPS